MLPTIKDVSALRIPGKITDFHLLANELHWRIIYLDPEMDGCVPVHPAYDPVLCFRIYSVSMRSNSSKDDICERSRPYSQRSFSVLKFLSTLPLLAPSLTGVCRRTVPTDPQMKESCSLL